MDSAIAIVVVAHRAIEKVIAEDAIESFHLGSGSLLRLRGDVHSIGNLGRAGRIRRPSASTMQVSHV
jgi:hypothetical protein